MKKIYLVDTENVHSVWVKFLSSLTSDDEMVLFYTANSQGLSYSDLDALRTGNYNFRMIKCFTGRNGLDFQLSSYLGYLICENPTSEFYIIANDNGYDAMIRFWAKKDISVKRLSVDAVKRMTAANEALLAESKNKESLASSNNETEESIFESVLSTPETSPVETELFEGMNLPELSSSEVMLTETIPDLISTEELPFEEIFVDSEAVMIDSSKESEFITDTTPDATIPTEIPSVPTSEEPQKTSKRRTAGRKRQPKQASSSQLEIKTLPQTGKSESKDPTVETEVSTIIAPAETASSAESSTETPKKKKTRSTAKTKDSGKTSKDETTTNKTAPDGHTKKAPIKNKTKATPIIKAALQDCSFKITAKDVNTILEVMVYECPAHDLRTLNNKLVQSFDQSRGSEIYKKMKQAKAITEVYRLISNV